MSLPYFDDVVTLYSFDTVTAAAPQIAQNFQVEGEIGSELVSQDFAVLVSIWQTEEDTTSGGSAANVVAHALGLGAHDKASGETRWSAKMLMRGPAVFTPGSVTGVGLVVASNDDPTSFETYSWIRRLRIEVAPSPTSAFTP